MNQQRQRGFTLVEVLLVVVVVALLVTLGFVMVKRSQTKSADSAQNTSISETDKASSEASVPAIKDTKDLDTASATIDSADLDSELGDTNELDSELSAF